MTEHQHAVHDRSVELSPAAEFDVATLARVFTAGYEGYWFPVELDAAGFERMATIVDADLGLSRVATVDGEPVAIVLLARRNVEGWVGGMGVAAPHRRRGLGKVALTAALDAARDAGIERVTLEVLGESLATLDEHEIARPDTARQDLARNDTRAGTELDHAMPWCQLARHGSGERSAARGQGTDRERIRLPAASVTTTVR